MKVVIAGGTGFLGRPLTTFLLQDRHEVVVLTRGQDAAITPGARGVPWNPNGVTLPMSASIMMDSAGVTPTPEPSALVIIAGGLFTQLLRRRRGK